jgi:hypothetical protein
MVGVGVAVEDVAVGEVGLYRAVRCQLSCPVGVNYLGR